MTEQRSGAMVANRIDGLRSYSGHLALYRLIWRSPIFQMAALYSVAIAIVAASWRDLGLATMPMALIMLLRFMNQRATLFEAALPVRAREVVLARMLSILALIWLPVVTWILASGSSHPFPGLRDIPASTKIAVLGLGTLVVIVPNLISMGRMQVPLLRAVILPASGLAIVGVLAIQIFSSPEVLIVLAAAIFTSCWFLWTRMPESFLLTDTALSGETTFLWDGKIAPSERMDSQSHATGVAIPAPKGMQGVASTKWDSRARARDDSASKATSLLTSWRPILRSAVTPITWLGFASALLFGALPSSNWIFYVALWTMIAAQKLRPQLQWIYALPLSFRAFTLTNVAGAVFPVLLGLAIGIVASPFHLRPESMSRQAPHSDASDDQFLHNTRVPLDFWLRAPAGRAPQISSPWGEARASDTMTVLGVLLYNPYSAEKTSSPRFVEWQFERATHSVYGRVISRAAYDSRSVVLPRRSHDTPAVYVLGSGLVVAFALFVVLLLEFPRAQLFSRRPWLRNTASSLIMVPMLGLMYLDFIYTRDYSTDIIIPLFRSAFFSLSEHMPGGLATIILLSALSVIALYRLVEWQFSRSEFADRAKPKGTWWS